jgi:hypothetical protein
MLTVRKQKKTSHPGTTPLVTISAKESNCNPSGPETFNNRAKNHQKI